jgi:hypothetical protein
LNKNARRRGKEEIREELHLRWLDCELRSALDGKSISRKLPWFGLQHLEEIVTRQELCAEINNAAEERELWDSLFLHDEEPLSYIDTLMRPSTHANDDGWDDIDDGWDDIDDRWENPISYEPSPMSAEWKQTWLDGAPTPDNDDYDDYWDRHWDCEWEFEREEDIWEVLRNSEADDGKIIQFSSDAADERNAERGLAGERYFQTAKRTVRKYGTQRNGAADSLKKPSLANTSRKALRNERKLGHG